MNDKIWDVNEHARVIGYGRVSTEDQLDNYSPEIQKQAFEKDKKRYCWVDFPIMFESGTGTSITERDVFREVLRRVQNGEADAVWAIDPDRLARPDDMRLWTDIYEIFVDNNVKVVTPTRIYDLRVDNDLFSFEMEGILAKHNRRRLLQNMNRGKIAKARDGKNAGGAAPDGYLVDQKVGKYIHDLDRKEYALLAWDLVWNHDYTLRQLVKEFDRRGIRSKSGKKWSLAHFHDMFYNEEYIGTYIYGRTKYVKDKKAGRYKRIKVPESEWIKVKNAHEPLIAEDIFYGVQAKLKWRRKRINHNTHMLTGIATCYLCGSPMHVKFSSSKRHPKYVCTNKRVGCQSRWLDLSGLNDKVWGKFKYLLEHPQLIQKLAEPLQNTEFRLAELRSRLGIIQGNISKVEGKKSRLLDLYLDGKYSKPELDAKSEEMAKGVKAYQEEYSLVVAGIRALEEQPNDLREIIKYMEVLHYSDTQLSYDQKVRVFRQFVYKVELDDKLDFDFELYKTPIGEIPVKFRSFPKHLTPDVAVKGSVADGLGDVFSLDHVAAGEVTHSSGYF